MAKEIPSQFSNLVEDSLRRNNPKKPEELKEAIPTPFEKDVSRAATGVGDIMTKGVNAVSDVASNVIGKGLSAVDFTGAAAAQYLGGGPTENMDRAAGGLEKAWNIGPQPAITPGINPEKTPITGPAAQPVQPVVQPATAPTSIRGIEAQTEADKISGLDWEKRAEASRQGIQPTNLENLAPTREGLVQPGAPGIGGERKWTDAAGVKHIEGTGIGQKESIEDKLMAVIDSVSTSRTPKKKADMLLALMKEKGDIEKAHITGRYGLEGHRLTADTNLDYRTASLEERRRQNDIHAADFKLRLAQQQDINKAKLAESHYQKFVAQEIDPMSGKAINNELHTLLNMGMSPMEVPSEFKPSVDRAMTRFEEYYKKGLGKGEDTPLKRKKAMEEYKRHTSLIASK